MYNRTMNVKRYEWKWFYEKYKYNTINHSHRSHGMLYQIGQNIHWYSSFCYIQCTMKFKHNFVFRLHNKHTHNRILNISFPIIFRNFINCNPIRNLCHNCILSTKIKINSKHEIDLIYFVRYLTIFHPSWENIK